MRRPDREVVFAGAIVAALLVGVVYGLAAHTVPAASIARTVALKGAGFSSRALYCPPSVSRTKDTATLAVTASGRDAVPFSVAATARPTAAGATPTSAAPAPSPSSRPRTRTEKVAPGAARFEPSRRDRAVNVVAYGGQLVASASTIGGSGAGATPCAPSAARQWYFPEGSSALGYNERLILYNPFPDEAVARVSFLTPDGKQTKANLADKAVPAGSTVILRLNAFILKEPLLSLEVDAIRGRLVAWRSMRANPGHRLKGQEFSLGATAAHTEWFLPDGAVGRGYNEQIALLNPGSKTARVSISVLTSKRTLQPPKLLNLNVPPSSSRRVGLSHAIRGCSPRACGLGAVVTSAQDVGIVVERTMYYARSGLTGVASEVGATRTAQRWYLGPAATSPSRDVVTVIDPTTVAARFSLSLAAAGGKPFSPKALQNLKLSAGTRRRILIDRWTRSRPVIAILTSNQQVVAERFSYSNRVQDGAAVMGMPLP